MIIWFRRRSRSASLIVGSMSIKTSPALTRCPSPTWIARTTPVSNGCIFLILPLGMILPVAVATMSTFPTAAQVSAVQNTAMITRAITRPAGVAWSFDDFQRRGQEGQLLAVARLLPDSKWNDFD